MPAPPNMYGRAAPPFLIVHGTADSVVPHAQSVLLEKRLTAAGVDARLELVPGAGHAFSGSPDIDALVDQAVDYLVERLH